MAKPTDRLKKEREQAGLTLEDVQNRTKIQIRYLQAVEEADFSVLPGKFYTRAFIRAYAEFLGVDPAPVINQYEETLQKEAEAVIIEEEAPPVLSRKERHASERMARSAKRGRSSLRVRSLLPTAVKRKRGYAWLLLVVFILLIPAVIVFFSTEEEAQEEKGEATVRAEPQKSPVKKNEATVRLVKPSETYEYGDVFEVSKAEKVEVTVEASKNTWFRYRPGGPENEVEEEERLSAGEKKVFEHPEWISLMIGHPEHVKLIVNGHVIDTSEEKKAHAYQLKRKK